MIFTAHFPRVTVFWAAKNFVAKGNFLDFEFFRLFILSANQAKLWVKWFDMTKNGNLPSTRKNCLILTHFAEKSCHYGNNVSQQKCQNCITKGVSTVSPHRGNGPEWTDRIGNCESDSIHTIQQSVYYWIRYSLFHIFKMQRSDRKKKSKNKI